MINKIAATVLTIIFCSCQFNEKHISIEKDKMNLVLSAINNENFNYSLLREVEVLPDTLFLLSPDDSLQKVYDGLFGNKIKMVTAEDLLNSNNANFYYSYKVVENENLGMVNIVYQYGPIFSVFMERESASDSWKVIDIITRKGVNLRDHKERDLFHKILDNLESKNVP